MKTILICPEHRAASSTFNRMLPLALMPILGQSLIAHYLNALATQEVKEVLVLASDRPELIRDAVGNGSAWGLTIEIIATRAELSADEARAQFGSSGPCQIFVLDRLPDCEAALWSTYADTFAKLNTWMADESLAASLTMKEVSHGVWISTKALVAESAVLHAPAWIGPQARIGDGAIVGPHAIVESNAFIDEHVSVRESWIGPSTYIGPAMNIDGSFVWGQAITHWRDGAVLEVQDEFVLNNLAKRENPYARSSLLERLVALMLWLVTMPFALLAMLALVLQRKPVLGARQIILPPLPRTGFNMASHTLHQINTAHPLLRRWPELWQVVKGAMALVGNRPLSLQAATALRGEMGQLWIAVPAGVFSLADSEGDDPEAVPEGVAHAAYFATHSSFRLKLHILRRCAVRMFAISFQPTLTPSYEYQYDY